MKIGKIYPQMQNSLAKLQNFLPWQLKNSKGTGKSLSEALIFAEHGENMLCT